ncbi:MAG: heavy metal-responsive transcriptional regulator [Nitriliruptoraceae bacterium]
MRIGQLVTATGMATSTLRYDERTGLLPAPARTDAGYRDYPTGAIDRVAFVRSAQTAGLTLAQVAEILVIRDDGRPPCAHVADLVDVRLADIDRRLADLGRARTELRRVRGRLDQLDPADCGPTDVCSAIAAAR